MIKDRIECIFLCIGMVFMSVLITIFAFKVADWRRDCERVDTKYISGEPVYIQLEDDEPMKWQF
jgi:hypothetical protein